MVDLVFLELIEINEVETIFNDGKVRSHRKIIWSVKVLVIPPAWNTNYAMTEREIIITVVRDQSSKILNWTGLTCLS